jgi:hypothetical protein
MLHFVVDAYLIRTHVCDVTMCAYLQSGRPRDMQDNTDTIIPLCDRLNKFVLTGNTVSCHTQYSFLVACIREHLHASYRILRQWCEHHVIEMSTQ